MGIVIIQEYQCLVFMNILDKIKSANLVGRGGAGFPTAMKWESVYKSVSHKDHVICEVGYNGSISCQPNPNIEKSLAKKCYIVVNCAEGEPGVKKDGWLLANKTDRVIDGLRLALEFLGAGKVYFYINHEYYGLYEKKIMAAVRKAGIAKKFVFFVKPIYAGYIGGEETAILNIIEGQKPEPRLRPPFPTAHGLWGWPTLVNNVETFYNVSLVDKGEFKDERLFGIGGQIKHKGVFSLPAKMTIKEVLQNTKNWPEFDFFVQVGGDASGEVLNMNQLDVPASGAASITVYDLKKHNALSLLRFWLNFFRDNSCGQCTPCREGTYRLVEILENKVVDWKTFFEIIDDLEASSFCALGGAVPYPVRSYFKNISDLKNKI